MKWKWKWKWKRPAACLLAAAMMVTMSGVPAFAVETDVSGVSGNAPVECICETHCEQEAVNPDCPVCAAEDADLSACLGKEAAVLSVQAMINALPDEPTEENAEDVSAKLGEIDEAMAALGDEERAALDLTQYQAAIAALAALAAAQGEIALYADDINKPRNGTGTTEDPYQIASTDEMEWFRDTVNAGNTEICAKLMNDLNFDNKQDNSLWTWTPIGNSEVNAYTGTFDGNGYEIKEIRLVDVQAQSQTNRGLFGWIGTGGKVQDLAVSVKYVGNSSLPVSDSGLLSVNNAGTIERCSATISNALYTDSFGMIAYKNSGNITDCWSYVNAKLSISGKAAGIARTNTGTISNCFFRGSFRTGKTDYAIAENKNGSITNCYYRDANNGRNGEVYIDGNKDTGDTVVWKSTSECNSGEVAWLLNNSGSKDTWRMGSNKYPSLKKTDGRVNKNQDGSYNIGDKPHMHGDVEFTKVAALSDIKATGNYYIDAAVNVDNTWSVKGNVVLCLNGQTVTDNNGTDPAIEVSGNNSLTLLDCKGGKITGSGGTSILVDGGSLTLGGKAQITGNDKNILLTQDSKISFDSLDPSAKFGISVENQKDLSDPVAVTDATGGQYFGQLVADGFKDNGVGFELYLSDDGKTVMLGKQSAHTHCICGDSSKNVNGHTHGADITFQPWTETDKLPTSGNYYLTRNVTLTKNATLQNANVCLNGYTVTLSDVGRIMSSGTTQLTDCSVGGKLESYSGKANGGVAISNGNTFCLYGGTLNGVKVEIGQTGGGTFNMYGGKITGNTKGTVVGQSKNQGGGVFVGSGNQFNMYGGTIQNNSAVDGGGVYIASAYNAYSAGEMTICGDAVIQGNNKAGGVTNNVSLPSGKQITISGELVKNANIGVTTRANLSQGNVNIATATDAGWVVAKNFTSDNSAYDVGLVNDGKTVQLQVHSHQWKYTANGATITAACKAPSCPAPAGGSVTINKPAHTTYGDGQSENATLTENNWQGLAVNQIAITYKKGNDILKTAPTDAGTYTANITLDGATASVKYTIAKAVPKVEDFTFAAPKDLVYNGQAKSAEVKAKDSVKGMGNITVKYYQSETEVEPINAGRYIVKISVEEGTNYATATDLKIGELTISEDTLPEGTGTDKSVTIRYNDTEVKTYTYTDFGFTAAGTFAVKGSVTEGTSLLATGYPKFESNGVQVKLATGLSLDGSEKKVVIPMTFTPNGGNYKHKEVTLTITLADKVTDTSTMKVTQAGCTFGDTLPDYVLTGKPDGAGEVTVLYTGSTLKEPSQTYSSANAPTDAGTYTVKVTCSTEKTNYEATSEKFTIKPKSIAGATITLELVSAEFTTKETVYTGSQQTVKVGSVTLTDMKDALTDNTDYTVEIGNGKTTGTNVGTYTVEVKGTGNYKDTANVSWKITPAELTIADAIVAAKTYDGKKDATVNSVSFTGFVNNETLTMGSDYTATGEFNDANAGDNKNVTVTVTLNNTDTAKNYTLKNGGIFNKTGVTISKAATPAAPTGLYGIKGQKLSTVILPAGWSWVNPNTEMSEAGSKTFTANYHDDKENYQNGTNVNVTVDVKDKKDVSNNISFPDGKLTYDPTKVMTYEKATIDGIEAGTDPKWTYTYILDTGNGKLNNDGKPIAVGSYVVTAIYEDSKNIGRKTAMLVVDKVKPTGGNSSSSSSGGSSGGGGGGAAPAPTPAGSDVVTVKDDKGNAISGSNVVTTTKTTVNNTKNETSRNEQGQTVSKIIGTVSKETAEKLVAQAVSNRSDIIEITVSSAAASSEAADTAKSTELEIPKTTVASIAKDTDASLVVKTDSGSVTLDNKTLETITSETNGDTVKLIVKENAALTEAQRAASAAIGENGKLFDLAVQSGNRLLHDFQGGKAYVILPMPDKLKGKDILVIYIDDNGLCKILNHSVVKIGAEYYIRFTTTRFSTFAVVDKDEAEGLIKEQNAAHVKELMQSAKFKVTTTKTSKKSVKVQVAAKSSKTMISDIKSLGYTVKYQFYRSTKKTAGYKLRKTSSKNSFISTKGTKGRKYYYKARVLVYDGKTLVAKSALRQCSYGARTWIK